MNKITPCLKKLQVTQNLIWLIVDRSGCESWQENYKTLQDRKSCECYLSKKIQETNFKMKFFPFFVFSRCFFSVFIIRTTKWQSAHVSKTSIVNELITTSSWRNQDKMPYWIFRKIIWFGVIWSLFPQDNFCFISIPLFSQNLNFSVVMLTDLIKCNYRLPKTNRSYMRIFSIGLYLLLSNTLKNIFVLRTSSSPSFNGTVKRLNVHVNLKHVTHSE